MTDPIRPAAIEAMARAMCAYRWGLVMSGDRLADFVNNRWRDWVPSATAALDALRRLLDERGCVVAPRVATEEMAEAANALPITATVNWLIGTANAHGMRLPLGVDGIPLHQWYAAMIAALTAGGDALGEE